MEETRVGIVRDVAIIYVAAEILVQVVVPSSYPEEEVVSKQRMIRKNFTIGPLFSRSRCERVELVRVPRIFRSRVGSTTVPCRSVPFRPAAQHRPASGAVLPERRNGTEQQVRS